MEKGSEIKSAIEELSMMVKLKPSDNHDAAAHIPTKPFLYVCNLFVQVLGRSSLSLSFLYLTVALLLVHVETHIILLWNKSFGR